MSKETDNAQEYVERANEVVRILAENGISADWNSLNLKYDGCVIFELSVIRKKDQKSN